MTTVEIGNNTLGIATDTWPDKNTSVWVAGGIYGWNGIILINGDSWDDAFDFAAESGFLDCAKIDPTCDNCHGSGLIDDEECEECNGTGVYDDGVIYDGHGEAYNSDEVCLSQIRPDHEKWSEIVVALWEHLCT